MKKKVCFILPFHHSASMGGAEYQAKLVLESLSESDLFQIYYLCRESDDHFIPRGYEILKIGKNNIYRKYGYYFDTKSLLYLLKTISPDIIYQNVACAYTGISAFYAKKYGAKFIWHIASDNDLRFKYQNNFRHRIKNIFERIFINYGIKNADIIAGQTKYQNSLLKKYFNRDCNALIPIGHPKPIDNIIKSKKIKILWVANLKPLKQPEIFIRLAKEISLMNNDVEFLIIGRCGGDEWSQKIVNLIKSTKNISYLGEVTPDEVNNQMNEAHILVNTSLFEGFSNTFVQAWMRSVPIVSLNTDPDNILVEQNIGFCSKNFEQLVIDVNTLINNKTLREDMGNKARYYALNHHTTEKMLQVFSSLLCYTQCQK